MDFYKILKVIMDEKKMKISDVCKATGLADSTVRSIFDRKTKKVSLDVAYKISIGLNVSLQCLNGEKDIKTTISSASTFDRRVLIEEQLLSNFNKLNDLGKKEATKRVSELTELSIYVTSKEEYNFAAHDDGLDPEEAKRRIDKAKAIFKQMDEE